MVPTTDHGPTQSLQLPIDPPVPQDVLADLFRPIPFRQLSLLGPVAVPEPSVDEDRYLQGDERHVGAAGNLAIVAAVAEAERIKLRRQKTAQGEFRLGVFAPDLGHDLAALGFGEDVGHLGIISEAILAEPDMKKARTGPRFKGSLAH